MWRFNLIVLSFSLVWQLIYCQRRITNGRNVTTPKRYMVYLVKTTTSPRDYDYWLCGGVLVKPEFVVTSAACVSDVQFMYVVAGLYKYFPNVGDNECANKIKKRVIMTYRYAENDFEYDDVNKWAKLDIAVAKLETPYKREQWMVELCDFVPGPIAINYDPSYEEPGEKVMALGWGHASEWRTPNDTRNLNQRHLQYTSTEILSKEICNTAYSEEYKMSLLIGKYMICADRNGGLDEKGNVYSKKNSIIDLDPVRILPGPQGCITSEEELEGVQGPKCQSRRSNRRSTVKSIENVSRNSDVFEVNINQSFSSQLTNTRRYGICQNDHGGPLVAWVDGREMLIGIASVFLVTKDNKCAGPYLYTSTTCTNVFLRCVIEPKPSGRRSVCDKPPKEKGFHTIENGISWKEDTNRSVTGNNETSLLNTTNPSILNITNKT